MHVFRVAVDWSAIADGGSAEAGAAIRIASFAGPFEGASAAAVATLVREVLEEARTQGVTLREVQIDFDAAASRLGGYRTWISSRGKDAGEWNACHHYAAFMVGRRGISAFGV